MIVSLFRRIYAPECMIKKELIRGELPSAGEAYATSLHTAWASIAETFLIALISMMDTMMVGVVGPHAIAAVGLVTQPRFIVLAMIMALNMAVTSITARRRGENDPDGAVRCLKQALILCLASSILLSLIAFLGRTPLLLFAGAQDDTIELAREYYEIILLGTPFNAISMTISAAQRGIGAPRVSMQINIVANVISFLLKIALISGRFGFPALGVRGAAISTAIGWTCGLVISIVSVAHRESFLYILTRDGWHFDKETMHSIYMVASGSFVEQICLRIGFLAYNKVVAGLGTMVFAAHNICMNIMSLSFSFGEGLGIAASALVGQNLGAKRPDLSIVYGKVCQRMSFVTSVAVLMTFIFGGDGLIRMFTSEPEIIATSRAVLIIAGVVIFGQASQMIFMGSLRGAGDTRYTAVVSLLCVMVIRPVFGYIFAYPLGLGLVGVWCAFVIDQYLRLTLTARRFSSGKWMSIEL